MRLTQFAWLGVLLVCQTTASTQPAPHFDAKLEAVTFNKQVLRDSAEELPGVPSAGRDRADVVGVLVDPKIDTAKLFSPSGPSLLPRGASGPTLADLK